MPVFIKQITSEVVLPGREGTKPAGGRKKTDDAEMERIARIVTERVVERLRREWEP